MKMADAKQKRNEQLKRWLGSETDQEPPVLKKKKTKVKFDDGAVFLAACSSGDTEEVLRMLDRGADINYANVDGLTALHQVRVCVCVTSPSTESEISSPPLAAASPCNTCQMEAILIPLFTSPSTAVPFDAAHRYGAARWPLSEPGFGVFVAFVYRADCAAPHTHTVGKAPL